MYEPLIFSFENPPFSKPSNFFPFRIEYQISKVRASLKLTVEDEIFLTPARTFCLHSHVDRK